MPKKKAATRKILFRVEWKKWSAASKREKKEEDGRVQEEALQEEVT